MVKTIRPVQGFPTDKMLKFHLSNMHLNSKLVFKASAKQNWQSATAGESVMNRRFSKDIVETIAHKKTILKESIYQLIHCIIELE